MTESSEERFILNPCMTDETASPMILVSTGFRDYIGGHGGFCEGGVIIDLPLAYQDLMQQQKISIGMQPVYLPLGPIKFLSINPVSTYFFDKNRAEDQHVVSIYENCLRRFLSSHVVQPSTEDIRRLTSVPK